MEMDDWEEIDSSDDGKIRLYRVGPQRNKDVPDPHTVKAWKSLHDFTVNEERCCNCNFWECDSWRRDTWCNIIAKECHVDKPYAPRDGWCGRWEKNCTTEDWKRRHHYNGWRIMYPSYRVNPYPRPTEEYNCTTCPAHYDEHDPDEYPSLAEFKRCRVAERETGYQRFTTTVKDVCELHPDTEKVKGGEE
jgi:hypothetical protein